MWTVNNALADNFLDLLSQVVTFVLFRFFLQTQNFDGIFFYKMVTLFHVKDFLYV